MADSVKESAEEILQNITRHINCLGDDNRNTRKRALEGIKKETLTRKPAVDPKILQVVFNSLARPILKILSDPVEKCRELSIAFLSDFLNTVTEPEEFLPYVIPVLVQRLGQPDIIETSEELRLNLVELIQSVIIKRCGKQLAVYLDDMVKILHRTIVDPYPEVKKCSCQSAAALAKAIPEHFHVQSESLINPLLQTISHQHSRVRLEAVNAIGAVIQNGNNKSVEDVVTHFAQRLFDHAPSVRLAVTKVVGHWLLDLMDRYSFHRQLLPLLLTSVTDELPEISETAEALWHDVGLKYESENEEDLKDKQDFGRIELEHYPRGVERPNLGCRELVYRNVSKILPGLLRDLPDWVVETRIKSAALLYILLLNAEDNITQHIEKVLSGLFKACVDEEPKVVKDVIRSAELLGYFLKPEVWCKACLQSLKLTRSAGTVTVLAAIIRGSQRSQLQDYLQKICDAMTQDEVCRTVDVVMQRQLLCGVESVVSVCQQDCAPVSLQLFTVVITVLALQNDDQISHKAEDVLQKLCECQGLSSVQELYNAHTRQIVQSLKESYIAWTTHSEERLVFDALLIRCGPVVGELLDDIIPMMVANLKPEKEADVRQKFFSLLSRLMMNAADTLDSTQRFGDFAVTVVRDMILPNCVWHAGRAAAAIRTTAVSCLWALLHSGVLNKEKLLEVSDELITQLKSSLEDDNKNTRLVVCRVLMHMFTVLGHSLDQDRLHNMYPELLKRLDDSSDDIRIAVSKTFVAYFECFAGEYNVGLYRAHLEALYRGLLVHLDDPDQEIQEAILEVLKKSASLSPGMLHEEVETVKHKHRSTKYCDKLSDHLQSLKVTS